jgi:predicted transcriptional regulator
MSAVAKKLHTERVTIKIGINKPEIVFLPKDAADNLLLFIKNVQPVPLEESKIVRIDDIYPKMKDPAQKAASILRGARHKEGMNQVELAQQLGITQSDLSKMENGRRSIGKVMAKRLAEILKVDYRIFL